MMGPERKSMIMTEEEKRNTAYHEGGHALVAAMLPDADPVHKVTIIPRGRALGVTMQLPTEDKYSHTKEYLERHDHGHDGRPHRRGEVPRPHDDRRRQRHRAGDRPRPQDGLRVGHERDGPADLRPARAGDLPRPRLRPHAGLLRGARPTRSTPRSSASSRPPTTAPRRSSTTTRRPCTASRARSSRRKCSTATRSSRSSPRSPARTSRSCARPARPSRRSCRDRRPEVADGEHRAAGAGARVAPRDCRRVVPPGVRRRDGDDAPPARAHSGRSVRLEAAREVAQPRRARHARHGAPALGRPVREGELLESAARRRRR